MSIIDFSDLGSALEKTLKDKEFSYKTKYGGEVRDIVSEVFIINSISWGDEVPRKPVQTPKGIINLPTELDNKWDKPEIKVRSKRGFAYEFERCRFR
jgi:hypothetical protein